ncbi:MAG TPA: hypothetical protein VMU34_08025 [Mycobacterium sp.]|nr:hypothetical protein [Mycobacterium sp.]
MTEIRVIDDGQEQDPATVLWIDQLDDGGTGFGDWVALLSVPDMNYVIAKRVPPFAVDGDASFVPPLDFDDTDLEYFALGRPQAGQLAVALITALINNSDHLIDSYIEQIMARR